MDWSKVSLRGSGPNSLINIALRSRPPPTEEEQRRLDLQTVALSVLSAYKMGIPDDRDTREEIDRLFATLSDLDDLTAGTYIRLRGIVLKSKLNNIEKKTAEQYYETLLPVIQKIADGELPLQS